MSRKRIIPVLLVAGLLSRSLPSCIMEDRSLCPCTLSLDLSEVKVDCAVSVTTGDEIVEYRTFEADSIPPVLWIEVPRQELIIGVGTPAAAVDADGSVTIPPGQQCPELWIDYEIMQAEGESVSYKADIHKNYCLISVRLSSSEPGTSYPFRLSVSGGVCGYLAGGEPSAGYFCADMERSAGNPLEFVCRVPRQVDNSLMLEVSSEGKLVRSFALGEYMAEAGFNWDAEDLEDACVEIDYSLTRISVTISAWPIVSAFETVI